MPIYKNTLNKNVEAGDSWFGALEEKTVKYKIPEVNGIEKISDEPKILETVIFGETVTNETVEIPYVQGRICLSVETEDTATITVEEDNASVTINSSDTYVKESYWKYMSKIKVEGTAQIIVERVV